VNACAALFGKINWNVGVGDRCVKFDELGNDPQDIELVNSVGNDSTDFMKGKVWLLTSDDVEGILCSMGYTIATSTHRVDGVGGIAHTTGITINNGGVEFTAHDSDPHWARLKVLQKVVNNEQSLGRTASTEESPAPTNSDEPSASGIVKIQ